MGWCIGYDSRWKRDVGYGVPAVCDHPACSEEIDRGLAYVCGGEPHGGEHGCGLFFCAKHRQYAGDRRDGAQLCTRCYRGRPPFAAKPDVPVWERHKLRDQSWAPWRAENPALVAAIRASLRAAAEACR
jgi:hypothetical protein